VGQPVTTAAALVAIALGAGPTDAGEHLLAGATAFREGRFAEALVEFRVAERLGDAEAGPYAGAVLVKLGRPEEAVEAFGAVRCDGEDPLLSYYRALALRGAGLVASADAVLACVAQRSGPRLAEEIARLRADLAPSLHGEPEAGAIDGLMARGAAARADRRHALAAALLREAAALAGRRADRHRLAEARRVEDELRALAGTDGAP
jgi:hypothetical protein